jgi:hypothetical protein
MDRCNPVGAILTMDGTPPPHDPLDGRRGPRAPSNGTSAGRGKGTGAAPTCGGVARPEATVAPATMTTAVVVAWANDFVQKRPDEIGECSSRHVTEFLFFEFSLRRLIEQCLITCYE